MLLLRRFSPAAPLALALGLGSVLVARDGEILLLENTRFLPGETKNDEGLARRFADDIGCRLQIVVPPRADLLVPWLLGGRGDLVAASMTVVNRPMGSYCIRVTCEFASVIWVR